MAVRKKFNSDDWARVQDCFESGLSLGQISSITGMDKGQISKKAKLENWVKQDNPEKKEQILSTVEKPLTTVETPLKTVETVQTSTALSTPVQDDFTDDGLTLKQERFLSKWFELGNATEAYKFAYNTSGMKPTTISHEAWELLRNPKIAAIIQRYKKSIQLTAEDIIEEYEEARQLALQEKMPGPAVSATLGKAKVLGLDKLTLVGDKENPIRVVQQMSDDELKKEIERLMLRLTSIDAIQ